MRIRTLVYDNREHGREEWLAEHLGPAVAPNGTPPAIFLGRQCHGTNIHDTDRDPPLQAKGRKEFADCDGLITRSAGTILAVRTADCVPIVVTDATRPWLGAVHAGWRGTLAGILGALLQRALHDGCRPQNLHLWIGPHIHACHYQVSEQLCHRFQNAFPQRTLLHGERHLSLLEANIAQAVRAGVPEYSITASPLCTYEPQNHLPSYRRDGKCRGEIVTTAMIHHPS